MEFFHNSKPVWAEGLEHEINITCGFYAKVVKESGKQYKVCLAASSFYRLFINNRFICYGPARCAHGYYRVDEVDLSQYLDDGVNHLAIEAVGYNVNSFYALDQPSFLQAELFKDGRTIAATGADNVFVGFVLTQRRRKMQRFSFQRAIAESYILSPGVDEWRKGNFSMKQPVRLVCVSEKKMIARGIPMNTFSAVALKTVVARGNVRTGVIPPVYRKDRQLTRISEKLKGFKESDLELHLSDEVQEMEYFNRG